MTQKITTFLMFDGKAEEAMNYYMTCFKGAEITGIEYYGPKGPGAEGTVKRATFLLGGQEFMCVDSNTTHPFSFTPAMSLFVNCESEAEIEFLFRKLSAGGHVFMPLDNYGFSPKFGWVADSFGVSWQLNLVDAVG
jgi:predicted 3-demethylubiquinone-9 3-methyltransferase (glyoxalase superfamily)